MFWLLLSIHSWPNSFSLEKTCRFSCISSNNPLQENLSFFERNRRKRYKNNGVSWNWRDKKPLCEAKAASRMVSLDTLISWIVLETAWEIWKSQQGLGMNSRQKRQFCIKLYIGSFICSCLRTLSRGDNKGDIDFLAINWVGFYIFLRHLTKIPCYDLLIIEREGWHSWLDRAGGTRAIGLEERVQFSQKRTINLYQEWWCFVFGGYVSQYLWPNSCNLGKSCGLCCSYEIFPHKNTLLMLKELGEENVNIMESAETEEIQSRDSTTKPLARWDPWIHF